MDASDKTQQAPKVDDEKSNGLSKLTIRLYDVKAKFTFFNSKYKPHYLKGVFICNRDLSFEQSKSAVYEQLCELGKKGFSDKNMTFRCEIVQMSPIRTDFLIKV